MAMFELAQIKHRTLELEASKLLPNKEPPSHKKKKSRRAALVLK